MGTATAGALGLALAAVGAGIPIAQAAEWSMAPTLAVAVDNDTNRTLTTDAVPSSRGLSMSFDTRLQRATERLSLSLRPQFQLQRFDDPRFARSDDAGIAAAATSLITERSSFGLDTLLRDDSTLTAELRQTGIIRFGTRRRDEGANASWDFSQSERRQLELTASFSSSNYHGSSAALYRDYQYSSLGASETFRYSQRLSFSVSGSAGKARTQGFADATDYASLSIGFASQPSERTSVSAQAGVNRRREGHLTSSGVVGQLSISHTSELSGFQLLATRGVQPSGFGIFTQHDEVQLSMYHQLGPRLSAGVSAGLYRNTSAFGSFTFDNRTYEEASVRLAWQASEPWSVAARVLAERSSGPALPTASGWQVRLESVWSPKQRSISR